MDIADLEATITRVETAIRSCEHRRDRAYSNVKGGAFGLIFGIICLLFFWPLAVLLIPAGLMAIASGYSRQRAAIKELTVKQRSLASLRGQRAQAMAELRGYR